MTENTSIIPIRTPVVVIPIDWSDLIDKRAVFTPAYGMVVSYSKKQLKIEGSEWTVPATDVQMRSRKGVIESVAGFQYDLMEIFDKSGFYKLIEDELEKINVKIKGLGFEIADTESFLSRVPENAEFIKRFWTAQLKSLEQSVRFLIKKKRKLEDLRIKVIKKLEKMEL